MDEKFKQINKMVEYPSQGILSKQIFDEILDVTLFCMAKNSSISEHTSTKQGFVYVIEGKGIFNIENKEIKMVPGKIIYIDENAKHSLKVGKNTSFLLVLV